MYQFETQIRVRYGETDRMGYLYYGHYPEYFEVGRVETMRSLGIPYKNLEDNGILLPVRSLEIVYIKPAYYDELLTIKTTIPELPGAKIVFLYEIYNSKNELITRGKTVLVFFDPQKQKVMRIPEKVLKAFTPYFTATL